MPGNTIDVVISNCVINLSVDEPAVFAETFHVLRPGGRIGVSDVVVDGRLTLDERAERGSYVSCIAGALAFTEYREGLRAADGALRVGNLGQWLTAGQDRSPELVVITRPASPEKITGALVTDEELEFVDLFADWREEPEEL